MHVTKKRRKRDGIVLICNETTDKNDNNIDVSKEMPRCCERWGAGVETQKKCTGRGWGMGSSTIQ